jgi:hypothetical protein
MLVVNRARLGGAAGSVVWAVGPIMMLHDRDPPTSRASSASFSDASVARCHAGANACNIVIGSGAQGTPSVSPIRGRQPPIAANQRDHGADVK